MDGIFTKCCVETGQSVLEECDRLSKMKTLRKERKQQANLVELEMFKCKQNSARMKLKKIKKAYNVGQ